MGKKTNLIKDFFASETGKKTLQEENPSLNKLKEEEKPSLNISKENEKTAETPDLTKNQPTQKKPFNYNPKNISSQLQMSRAHFASSKGSDGSPLQLNLIQSESLRLAQNKITNLEEELEHQRRDNEKLIAASDLLEENMDRLKAENEELRREKKTADLDFANEKDILLATLEDVRKKTAKLEKIKNDLEQRLSRDFQSIHARESSLENKIEIMKMENIVLQKEKDKMIIDLKRDMDRIKENLTMSKKRNQELKGQLTRIRESLMKTVSVLRATVNNLEGCRQQEDSVVKKAS